MKFTELNHIPKVCIENPIGIMSKIYRKPDQIIHPYYFGDEAQKATCLWLKGLKPLEWWGDNLFYPKTVVNKGDMYKGRDGKTRSVWFNQLAYDKTGERAKIRSMTFRGIANAMAEQWG